MTSTAPFPPTTAARTCALRTTRPLARRATPTDRLVVEVIEVPGRFRSLLAQYGSLDEIEPRLHARSTDDGWSPVECIAHVGDSFHVAARCIVAMEEMDPRASLLHVDAPRAGSNELPTPVVLGSLHAAATQLGRLASNVDARVWEAPRRVGGGIVTVRDVLERVLDVADRALERVESAMSLSLGPSLS